MLSPFNWPKVPIHLENHILMELGQMRIILVSKIKETILTTLEKILGNTLTDNGSIPTQEKSGPWLKKETMMTQTQETKLKMRSLSVIKLIGKTGVTKTVILKAMKMAMKR